MEKNIESKKYFKKIIILFIIVVIADLVIAISDVTLLANLNWTGNKDPNIGFKVLGWLALLLRLVSIAIKVFIIFYSVKGSNKYNEKKYMVAIIIDVVYCVITVSSGFVGTIIEYAMIK